MSSQATAPRATVVDRGLPAWRPGSGQQALAAGLVCLGASLALFGAPLRHITTQCVCLGNDEGIPVWSFQWWPWALLHGVNPFWSHLIYAPQGMNLATATTLPGPALLLAAITLTSGPLVSFNVAMILSPALAAFFAFLLCRRISGRFWPGLLGGWLFGFSTYMTGQMLGHVNLTLIFLIPAVVHIVLRGLAGEISRGWFVGLLVLTLGLQFSISTEVFASFTLFGAITLLIAFILGDTGLRAALKRTAPSMLLAYAIVAVIVSPYLFYVAKGGGLPVLAWRDDHFSTPALAFVLPSMATKLGGLRFLSITRDFSAGFVEDGAYLGLPLILLLGLAVWQGRRSVGVRIAASAGLVVAVCSLGGHLQIRHATGIPLPWWPATHLPVLGLMLPARFMVYVWLIVAVLAAWWLANARLPVLAWGLALVAAAFLWPAVDRGYWKSTPDLPPLFTQARYSHVIGPRDRALLLPVGAAGNSMLWQAQASLRFSMASGYLVPPEAPDPYKQDPVYPTLTVGVAVPDQEAAAGSFLSLHHVTVAVVDPSESTALPWIGILQRLGWKAQTIGGAVVLRPSRGP